MTAAQLAALVHAADPTRPPAAGAREVGDIAALVTLSKMRIV